MTNISIKNFKIYNLEREYEKISKFLYDLSNHINKIYDNYCINIVTKNLTLGNINDIIKNLNTTYNNNILEVCKPNEDGKYDIENVDHTLYNQIYNLSNKMKLMNYDQIELNNILNNTVITNPYSEIKDDILKVCINIGFSSIKDGLMLLIGEQYECLFSDEENKLIDLYNKIFIPYSCNTIEHTNDKKIYFIKSKVDKEELLNNNYVLYIKSNDKKYYVLNGYFINDSLNILLRTSQKCYNFLYNKKKSIEDKIIELDYINNKFLKNYIKNCHIKNMITLTEEEFMNVVEIDYNKYLQIIKMSFMNLMKEFIRDNIENMYNIIRLLLLGSDENINIAGLLYGLTKDKKVGHYTVANIIYKNLSYISQIKLRKNNITIKNEIDRIKSLTIDDVDLKKQIVSLTNMPDNVKSIALEKVEEMKSSNNEYYKQQLFVKTLCKFPWISNDEDKIYESLQKNNQKSQEFLDNIENKLETIVYGHSSAKKELKELIGRWISNPSSSGSAIGLVGPPGVGKTLFAKGISKALDIPFAQIALGGQNDGELLYGHGYTYSGSQPGMVVKKMIEAGSSRCVLYFDELDKTVAKHGQTNEIMSILIHMTDPNMNTEFQDRFFQGINFPLNKVLMCFSYNDSKLVDKILLDRLKKIHIDAYSVNEKTTIVKDFLIKEISEMVGYENGSVIIENKENEECFDDEGNLKLLHKDCLKKDSDDHKCSECVSEEDMDKYRNIEFIIENYTLEAGVRELKRCIEKIFLKLNIDKIYKKGLFENIDELSQNNPIIIDRKTIIKYLDKPQLSIEKIHDKPLKGVINGLYATSIGRGGIVPIQIYKNEAGVDEKFILKLTGSQKDVMKESVVCALTAATHKLNKKIKENVIKNFPFGFHIHTPDGATPKDGPSAGCAFTTAFASIILGKKIKNDIAMTGEIDLTGKVTKIGGLLYKLQGAKKAGITHVYCSVENKEDYEKIISKNKDLICDNFKVSFVSDVSEIFKQVIIGITDDDLDE